MKEDEKMLWVGIDVSKKDFFAAIDLIGVNGDLMPLRELSVKEFKRTKVGAGSFLKWVFEVVGDRKFAVVMESTGYLSRELFNWIQEQELSLDVSIDNPRKIANHIKGLGLQHKTDKSDATAIARYGTERKPPAFVPQTPAWERLRELNQTRTKLIEARTMFKNREEALNDPLVRKINAQTISNLTKQINQIDKEIKAWIVTNPEILQEVRVMVTVPGVKFISAANILASMGSLHQYSPRSISVMAGLAPRIMDSGTTLKKTFLGRRGSARARQILYLNSIHSVKKIPELAEFYQRLLERGKTPMTCRCACMRKLLILLRALVVANRPYQENFQKKVNNED